MLNQALVTTVPHEVADGQYTALVMRPQIVQLRLFPYAQYRRI